MGEKPLATHSAVSFFERNKRGLGAAVASLAIIVTSAVGFSEAHSAGSNNKTELEVTASIPDTVVAEIGSDNRASEAGTNNISKDQNNSCSVVPDQETLAAMSDLTEPSSNSLALAMQLACERQKLDEQEMMATGQYLINPTRLATVNYLASSFGEAFRNFPTQEAQTIEAAAGANVLYVNDNLGNADTRLVAKIVFISQDAKNRYQKRDETMLPADYRSVSYSIFPSSPEGTSYNGTIHRDSEVPMLELTSAIMPDNGPMNAWEYIPATTTSSVPASEQLVETNAGGGALQETTTSMPYGDTPPVFTSMGIPVPVMPYGAKASVMGEKGANNTTMKANTAIQMMQADRQAIDGMLAALAVVKAA